MAKKNPRNAERRAVVEQMRKEQQRRDRRRSLMILGISIAVVLGLLALAVVPYVKDVRHRHELEGLALNKVGATESAAGCQPRKKADAQGSGQHITPGTPIHYPDAPPAFGKHWPNYLQGVEIRNFYTSDDRPEIERLVHSLEHGHTILWYDDTVKPGTESYDDIKAIAGKFNADAYFMSAPWHKSDGGSFPAGTHVALTHWTGPKNQQGIWQYCAKPSGQVVKQFLQDYSPTDAPEPGAA